jgi:hypothetical protein
MPVRGDVALTFSFHNKYMLFCEAGGRGRGAVERGECRVQGGIEYGWVNRKKTPPVKKNLDRELSCVQADRLQGFKASRLRRLEGFRLEGFKASRLQDSKASGFWASG